MNPFLIPNSPACSRLMGSPTLMHRAACLWLGLTCCWMGAGVLPVAGDGMPERDVLCFCVGALYLCLWPVLPNTRIFKHAPFLWEGGW
jgi:hypothetical protein